jgi:cyclic beta-1,2-glucan synthetase
MRAARECAIIPRTTDAGIVSSVTSASLPLLESSNDEAETGRLQALARAAVAASVRRRRRRLVDRLAGPSTELAAVYGRLSADGASASAGGSGAEWLLDNYYIVQRAIRHVRESFPRAFESRLPTFAEGAERGIPITWGVAREVARVARCRVELEILVEAAREFQSVRPLTMAEIWALPTLLRLALLERLADAAGRLVATEERVATDPASADDETVASCVQSLRTLETLDWKEFFEQVSETERVLRDDPGGAYARMDFETRDRYRRAVEDIAAGGGGSEERVALEAVRCAQVAPGGRRTHVGYFLVDEGRPVLEERVGARVARVERWRRWLRAHATPTYLGGIALGLALQEIVLARVLVAWGAGVGPAVVSMVLALVPMASVAVAAVNALVTRTLPPTLFPKLALRDGVPGDCSTLVAVPILLTTPGEIESLVEALEIRYLGNADPNVHFALLADLPDAAEETGPGDDELLARAAAGIRALNARHARDGNGSFHLFHRGRTWCETEGCWMGWERKRGKLVELHRWLLGARDASPLLHVGDAASLTAVRYVITLDADTGLPRDAARRLIGTLAHPLNRPELDPETGRLAAGYTVLQPRIEIDPTTLESTPLARLFASSAAFDPYARAVSDVYQDLFGEGIYVGKGIYDVVSFERSHAGRVPDGALLSHDLFEGIHGRAGLVTDIVLLEHYPEHYISYTRRLHRWARGDWQLVPWLRRRVPVAEGGRAPTSFSVLSRWKIVDNLRRALLQPAILGLLLVAWLWLPAPALLWTVPIVSSLLVQLFIDLLSPVLAAVRTGLRPVFSGGASTFWSALAIWALQIVLLPYEAAVLMDAVVRTLVRVAVTRRHLLEWTPAAQERRGLAGVKTHRLVWREMLAAPLSATAAVAAVVGVNPAALPVAVPFALLWAISPEVAWRLSRPSRDRDVRLLPADLRRLRLLARRTWRFFETFVGPEDQWLPPDHFQEEPKGEVAHRTSPTNVGLLQLATIAAQDLGYVGVVDAALRLRSTLETLERLERHRGHFLNWYDTRDLTPLLPRYVSTVDSGNLAACLLVVKQACLGWTAAPVLGTQRWDGLVDVLSALDAAIVACGDGLSAAERSPIHALRAGAAALEAYVVAVRDTPDGWRAALDELLETRCPALEREMVDTIRGLSTAPEPRLIAELRAWSRHLIQQLESMRRDADLLLPWLDALRRLPDSPRTGAGARPHAGLLLERLRRELRADVALGDIGRLCGAIREDIERIVTPTELPADAGASDEIAWVRQLGVSLDACREVAAERLRDLAENAARAERLVADMDFAFVYDRRRHLFYLGFNVTADAVDAHHYDLLASEARLASFVAIAKGDVPVEHWIHLGRPVGRVAGHLALLSWSATMFEYLMPSLLLREGRRTLLGTSCATAVRAQVQYAARRGVPWGISESGYYAFDAQRNYQYRAFGLPALGFKRAVDEELVVAPYASLLALPFAPGDVLRNLTRLEQVGALGTYGLYESIDFTASRVPSARQGAVVRSYMAHHQGMILAALDNALRGEAIVRRFDADPLARVADVLLYERVPARVPVERSQPAVETRKARASHRLPLETWTPSGAAVVPEMHVLSNGHLTVLVTAGGGGFGQWQGVALTRWEPDPTLDRLGVRIYVEEPARARLWSTIDDGGVEPQRRVVFHPHCAEFRFHDGDLAVRQRIVVAPDADAELREVVITNEGSGRRQLVLTSYGEVVLGAAADDRRHPAFSKLFVESEVLDEGRTLVFRRRPRKADDASPCLVHRLVLQRDGARAAGWETDRERFLGRGHSARRPAWLATERRVGGRRERHAPLDPVFALSAAVDLPPGRTVRCAWVTAVAESRERALAVARSYASPTAVGWVFEESASAVERELSAFGIDSSALQGSARLLAHVLQPHASLRAPAGVLSGNRLGQSALWRYGVSGDHPIVLVRLRDEHEFGLVEEVVRAHGLWRRAGLRVDLVVLSEWPSSYLAHVEERLSRAIADAGFRGLVGAPAGLFVIHADRVSETERTLLLAVASVVFRSDAGGIAAQLGAAPPPPVPLPGLVPSMTGVPPSLRLNRPDWLLFDNGIGGFGPGGSEYVIHLDPGQTTPAPWVNVIANPRFGFVVSESGGGYTWAENSYENRLTPWRNDPIADEPGETIYLRDEETAAVWSATPQPAPGPAAYQVAHGAGRTSFTHTSHGLHQRLQTFVPVADPVKILHLRVTNRLERPRRLTVTYYAEWVLGTLRDANQPFVVPEFDAATEVLLAQNPWNEGFADRVAFAAASTRLHGVTADRAEFLGRRGTRAAPAALMRIGLARTVQAGLDPCAALQVHIDLTPGETKEVHFLLGQAASRREAIELVTRYREPGVVETTLSAVERHWDELLGAVQVRTPDPAVDVMLNRWLLYQAVSSRILGRTGYYQSSGAFGFRDQLQDVAALVHAAPGMTRAHLLECARRQFAEGDVLHWWHPPLDTGIRTRCGDDLVWLPFVTALYVEATGDVAVLGEEIPFVAGASLGPGEHERYDRYRVGSEHASLYTHCLRALTRASTAGEHGLPLFGSGDWNDGMNRVGSAGRGESVWLGWFLSATLERFARVCERMDEPPRAAELRRQAAELVARIEASGWDGRWYRRGWYDDGRPLGSSQSVECQIDSVAESWAVLSGAADPVRAATAMRAVIERLVSEEEGLILLLAPPFDGSAEDPGYIRAYPPGVRENGGQYSHAAVWALWALAELGEGDLAMTLFQRLLPLRHARGAEQCARYRVEPYVMAADICTAPPHRGRGGWTWYTGAAGWAWRLGVERLLGLHREATGWRLDPCIPGTWEDFQIVVRDGGTTYRIEVENPLHVSRGVVRVVFDGEPLPDGFVPRRDDGRMHEVRVTLGRLVAQVRSGT